MSELWLPRHLHPARISLSLRLRRWYRCSALRVLLGEFRSLRHRIRAVLEILAWERQGHRGPLPSFPTRRIIDGTRNDKRACIEYMQQTQGRYPFLSIFDLYLLQE